MPSFRVDSHRITELTEFRVVSSAANAHATPASVDFSAGLRVQAPCTVAKALHDARALDLSHPPDLDAQDHWFAATVPAASEHGQRAIIFEGLATIAEVWLDGALLLQSDTMYVPHELPLPARSQAGAHLVICFRALKTALSVRRPRPRWRTRIVDQQQLRYIRTSLIGRTPGFCPNVPVVGPYRPVLLVEQRAVRVTDVALHTEIADGVGIVTLSLSLASIADFAIAGASLVLEGAAGNGRVALSIDAHDITRVHGALSIADVQRWWPHTHGAQPLSEARVELAGGVSITLGNVGFRTLRVDTDSDGCGFGLVLNDVPVFARGACWTTDELLTLGAQGLRDTLLQVRDAGMNMLRIGGTTAYESDAFYALCDELGILVFQDFMFANMDYPSGDSTFMASIAREVHALLGRIGHRPSLAVLCGGSEVEQQTAMLGLPRDMWESPIFSDLLPRLCTELARGVPYIPSTPTGGTLPFQADEGVSHYYGVGAYLRPLDDARRSQVRFAAECLAFANVPCRETIEHFTRDLEAPHHHPRWKERVPRDRGVGWDFEDVRDHYIRLFFGVEPRDIRYADPERYLALGHVAVGEAMLATYAEWRRSSSRCRGGLVFWLKDFWPGAGWGVIDSLGRPKSAYYYLARAMAPFALLPTDEGLNGLHLHALNDGPDTLAVDVSISLFRDGETPIEERTHTLTLSAHAATRISVEKVIGRFCDPVYAYRFGPPSHDLVVAHMRSADGRVAHAFHLPLGLSRARERDLGLRAVFETRGDIEGVLVETRRFAQAISLDVPGFRAADDHFSLEPGGQRWVALTRMPNASGSARGALSALNALSSVSIVRTPS